MKLQKIIIAKNEQSDVIIKFSKLFIYACTSTTKIYVKLMYEDKKMANDTN